MSDRGIIFSAPMVRALLAGTKRQTRRLLKQAPETFEVDGAACEVGLFHEPGKRSRIITGCCITLQTVPHAPGDRLYVRENWQALSFGDYLPTNAQPADVRYAATDPCADLPIDTRGYPWRPSIHMPRWASRLWLLVTEVRVQRLQDISEADAIAEGIDEAATAHFGNPIKAYAGLWDYLHGGESDQSWAANPWIVAVTFDVHRGNIEMEGAAA